MKKLMYTIVYVFIIVLFISQSGCVATGYDENGYISIENSTEIKNNFGITRKQFNNDFSFPEDSRVLEIADGLMKNSLTVIDTIEPAEYDINNIDWNINFSESSGTFQLYLQCLNPITYLVKAYEISGGGYENFTYLEQAEKFLLSWYKYEQNEELTKYNSKVWYDHGTALRAENIIYFALVANEAGYLKEDTKELIINLLNIHGEFLADESNYTKNHNHGIFQDRALLYTAYILKNNKSEEWIEIAENRLKEQVDFAFTDEMVHVENSPAYHIAVLPMFKTISDFLIQFDDKFGFELYNEVKKSIEFLTYMTKPNGALAAIGDSSDETADGKEIIYSEERAQNFDDAKYLYASTQGEEGEKPEKTSVFYPKSGYYISHNNWDNENYSNSTWMMFKSGYQSQTHKHSDDNSFMLYSKGKDIFVDPGWYNYNFGNRYRDYLVSSRAHNTVIVDGKTYSPTVENSYKVGIVDYGQEQSYDYVVGFNDMYEGVQMDRYFYNLGDAILIYDNIKSDNEHTYSQLFHASEDMSILEQSDNEILFKLNGTNYNVRVKQLLNNTSINVIKGDFDKEEYGYISKKINDLRSIYTVKFDVMGTNVDLVTLITIEDENGNIENINNIDFDMDNYIFKFNKSNNISINLAERNRINLNDVSVINDGSEFTFINNCIGDGFGYSWYIIDYENNSAIKKFEMSENNFVKYDFGNVNPGKYVIRAYIKDGYGQRKRAVVAVIEYNNDLKTWENTTSNYPYLNLIYKGQRIEQIDYNSYKFYVDYDYSFDTKIRWYIYRNNSYFDVIQTENDNMLDYNFDIEGEYSIAYYLTTNEGNNEYWNYSSILID